MSGGGGGVKNIYIGTPNQRGRGIGSWLGGLMRRAFPVIKRGLSNMAQESLHTGMNVLGDVMKGQPVKNSMKRRVIDSTDKLKLKFNDYLQGMGRRRVKRRRTTRKKKRKYIIGKGKKKNQSSKRRKGRQTAARLRKKILKKKRNLKKKRKSKKISFDIFS